MGVLSRLEDRAGRLAGLPPATTAFAVERNLRVPTRDGIELAADLYRTAGPAVGTLLIRGPYGRHFVQAFSLARVFAARGYHALFVSSRGTAGSGGTFYPMATEVEDGHDVVTWMTAQPWFTGTFATLGQSYLGHTQWAVLCDPPAEMVAAVVTMGPHDFSRHAWGSGAFKLDFLGWSHGMVSQQRHPLVAMAGMVTAGRKVNPALNRLPLVDAGQTVLEGKAPWWKEWVTRPDITDPFWEPTRHTAALDRTEIPVLLLGGWQDLFLEQTVEQYRHLAGRGVDAAMTIGPWSHMDLTAGALRVMTGETFDWLEEHLAHRSPRRRATPVRVYVTGADEWRDLPGWPPPAARAELQLYLRPGRQLTADPPPAGTAPSSFLFDPANPTPTVGGPLLGRKCKVDDASLAARADVLVFDSAVLEQPVEVLGAPVVELSHSSDNPYVDLWVRISDVDEKGVSRNITETYRRLAPEPAGESEARPVRLELRDVAHRFQSGHRIRLLVAGGCHPHYARNLGTGDNPGTGVAMRSARHVVAHGAGGTSALVLPTAEAVTR
jgi:putative CocE/NonD family hydrolase